MGIVVTIANGFLSGQNTASAVTFTGGNQVTYQEAAKTAKTKLLYTALMKCADLNWDSRPNNGRKITGGNMWTRTLNQKSLFPTNTLLDTVVQSLIGVTTMANCGLNESGSGASISSIALEHFGFTDEEYKHQIICSDQTQVPEYLNANGRPSTRANKEGVYGFRQGNNDRACNDGLRDNAVNDGHNGNWHFADDFRDFLEKTIKQKTSTDTTPSIVSDALSDKEKYILRFQAFTAQAGVCFTDRVGNIVPKEYFDNINSYTSDNPGDPGAEFKFYSAFDPVSGTIFVGRTTLTNAQYRESANLYFIDSSITGGNTEKCSDTLQALHTTFPIDNLTIEDDVDSTPPPPPGVPPPTDSGCPSGWINWLLCPAADNGITFINGLMEIIQGGLRFDILTGENGEAVRNSWQAFLGLANIAFVIVFLVIIYSTATSTGMKNFDIKKILPRLVIAAILVNISFWVCAAISDLVNIIGANIKDFIVTSLGNPEATNNLGNLGQEIGAYALIGVGIVVLVFVGGFFTVILGFLLIVAVLAFRQLALMVLIVISPLAFVAWLLPNTEKWFKKWFDNYIKMLLIYPMIMGVWGFSRVLTDLNRKTDQGLFEFIAWVAIQIAPAVAIIPIFKMGGELMGKMSDMTKKGIDSLGGNALRSWDKQRAKDQRDRTGRDIKTRATAFSLGKKYDSKTGQLIDNPNANQNSWFRRRVGRMSYGGRAIKNERSKEVFDNIKQLNTEGQDFDLFRQEHKRYIRDDDLSMMHSIKMMQADEKNEYTELVRARQKAQMARNNNMDDETIRRLDADVDAKRGAFMSARANSYGEVSNVNGVALTDTNAADLLRGRTIADVDGLGGTNLTEILQGKNADEQRAVLQFLVGKAVNGGAGDKSFMASVGDDMYGYLQSLGVNLDANFERTGFRAFSVSKALPLTDTWASGGAKGNFGNPNAVGLNMHSLGQALYGSGARLDGATIKSLVGDDYAGDVTDLGKWQQEAALGRLAQQVRTDADAKSFGMKNFDTKAAKQWADNAKAQMTLRASAAAGDANALNALINTRVVPAGTTAATLGTAVQNSGQLALPRDYLNGLIDDGQLFNTAKGTYGEDYLTTVAAYTGMAVGGSHTDVATGTSFKYSYTDAATGATVGTNDLQTAMRQARGY